MQYKTLLGAAALTALTSSMVFLGKEELRLRHEQAYLQSIGEHLAAPAPRSSTIEGLMEEVATAHPNTMWEREYFSDMLCVAHYARVDANICSMNSSSTAETHERFISFLRKEQWRLKTWNLPPLEESTLQLHINVSIRLLEAHEILYHSLERVPQF